MLNIFRSASKPNPLFEDDPIAWFTIRRALELWKIDGSQATFRRFYHRFSRQIRLLHDDPGLLKALGAHCAFSDAMNMTTTLGPINYDKFNSWKTKRT